MLRTNLHQLGSEKDFHDAISANENMMVCCGRMGPVCVPVYHAMEMLRDSFQGVAFYVMDYDLPDAGVIRDLPECRGFMGLPFTLYFRSGKVVAATSGTQSMEQIRRQLETVPGYGTG